MSFTSFYTYLGNLDGGLVILFIETGFLSKRAELNGTPVLSLYLYSRAKTTKCVHHLRNDLPNDPQFAADKKL